MCTYFNIVFSVSVLSRYSHTPNLHHIAMTKHVLDYLKYTLNTKLVYCRSDSKKVTVYTYINTNFANAPGRKSYNNQKSNQLLLPLHLKQNTLLYLKKAKKCIRLEGYCLKSVILSIVLLLY
jgi:hypothetical protein